MTFKVPDGWSRKAVLRELNKVAGEFEASCARGEVSIKKQIKEETLLRLTCDLTFDAYVAVLKEKEQLLCQKAR